MVQELVKFVLLPKINIKFNTSMVLFLLNRHFLGYATLIFFALSSTRKEHDFVGSKWFACFVVIIHWQVFLDCRLSTFLFLGAAMVNSILISFFVFLRGFSEQNYLILKGPTPHQG
ncbi:hypothetical protein ACFFRR_000293 [Megaselia abdita]